MRALFALLALAALAGSAQAHVSAYSEAQNLRVGDWYIFVDTRPAPMHQGETFNWTVYVGEGLNAAPVAGASVSLRTRSPGGNVSDWPLSPLPGGYHGGAARLREAGEHNLTVTVDDGTQRRSVNGSIRAWRDLGARIVMADEQFDAYTNTTVPLVFRTVDEAGQPVDAFADLALRMEHWDDRHQTLRFADAPALTRTGVGTWSAQYNFPTSGMYHMVFASQAGGFGYNDTPILHVTAVKRVDFGGPDRGTPLPFALLLGLPAAAALRRRL